jgi:hypothetical protein
MQLSQPAHSRPEDQPPPTEQRTAARKPPPHHSVVSWPLRHRTLRVGGSAADKPSRKADQACRTDKQRQTSGGARSHTCVGHGRRGRRRRRGGRQGHVHNGQAGVPGEKERGAGPRRGRRLQEARQRRRQVLWPHRDAIPHPTHRRNEATTLPCFHNPSPENHSCAQSSHAGFIITRDAVAVCPHSNVTAPPSASAGVQGVCAQQGAP